MTTFPHTLHVPRSRVSLSAGAMDRSDGMRTSWWETIHLRLLTPADASELHELIVANRERLAQWLQWPATQTFQDTVTFTRRAGQEAEAGQGFHCALVCDNRIAGVISYMEVNRQHRRTVLGYWLDGDHQGRGLMSGAVRLMVDHAISVWQLNRVEIRAAFENEKSRAIPQRLGFNQEAVLHEAELINGRYLDSVLYAMLATNWNRRPT
jgi:ribosomal-protein-serine acetyltransferase